MSTLADFNIPKFGFGTYQRHDDEAYRTVSEALEIGYRHIDTAEGYNNEEFVGRAIADSGIARDDIFITTKVAPRSFAPGKVRPAVERSLEKLQTNQVDLLLIHWPSPHNEVAAEVYLEQLGEVYDAGLTKHIGVSNFTKHFMEKAFAVLGDRPIRTNQVETHPYLRNRPIVDYCLERDIVMTAYSPLAKGAVANDPTMAKIGEAYDATAVQIALAFLSAEGHIVIPSSSNKQRIAENFAAADIKLTQSEISAIRQLDRGQRIVDGPWCPEWDV